MWICYVMLSRKENKLEDLLNPKVFFSTSRPLKLLHIDLFRPTKTGSLGGKHYELIVVDDYSRWTCVMFLAHKDVSLKVFSVFCTCIQIEKEHEIHYKFSCPITPQQNGVVERKNRSFQEMARTILNNFNCPKYF
ncbi:hypothetical protein CR513_43284, partial [Mucuna pruriens]